LTAIAVLALLALAAIAHTAIALSLRMLLGLVTLAYLGWQWRWQARQQGILLWRDGWQWRAGDHSARCRFAARGDLAGVGGIEFSRYRSE